MQVIESALASMEQIDPCPRDPDAARRQARLGVVRSALETLAADQPASLATQGLENGSADPCIQDDDLAGAGITESQLHEWLAREGNPSLQKGLRDWLESLPVAQRAVFVQRAVLGQGNEATAGSAADRRRSAAGWTSQEVSQTFRVALCSLCQLCWRTRLRAEALPA